MNKKHHGSQQCTSGYLYILYVSIETTTLKKTFMGMHHVRIDQNTKFEDINHLSMFPSISAKIIT